MAKQAKKAQSFNVVIVAQAGRLQYEAALFAASFRDSNPNFPGRLILAMPQKGGRWESNPEIIDEDTLKLYAQLDVEIIPFATKHFGSSYPNGNKIEALKSLPKGEPFVFFDTDTLILDDLSQVPFDFDRPSASNNVEGTWPVMELYGPGYEEIWGSLYDKFGLDFESSLDLDQPAEYWRRFLYFNAGYFYYRCPHEFGELFLEYALAIRDDAPAELVCQPLNPWLDQVALPLVIHALGGARDALEPGYLDGSHSCHYRFLPLLFARESDAVIDHLTELTAPNKVKKVLKQYDPMKVFLYQNRGKKARRLFDRDDLPAREVGIRKRLRNHGLWIR